jgi:hypothetical protein
MSSENTRRGRPPKANGDGKAADPIVVVLVEKNPDKEAGSQKDSVTITRATKLVEKGTHDLASMGFDDLEVG